MRPLFVLDKGRKVDRGKFGVGSFTNFSVTVITSGNNIMHIVVKDMTFIFGWLLKTGKDLLN